MTDRYDQLQPPSIIPALRSMPRRWASALHMPPPKNIEDFYKVAGNEGVSAAEHCGAAVAMLAALTNAIRTTTYNTPEELGPEVTTALQNSGSGSWPENSDDAIQTVSAAAEALADRLDALGAPDWNRQASGTTVAVLAQGAVRVLAERLTRVERVLAEVS